MQKKIGALGLLFALIAVPAFADNFETVPHPQAVFDTTLGTLFSICPPGQASACDPVVDTTSTQTLTNKTLTSPTINGGAHTGPVPVACGATCTLTSANSGQTTLLNVAAGSIATLPAATGTGNVYNFVVSATTTGAKDAILAASSSDAILGLISGENAGTGVWFAGSASTYHSLQMPFAGSQPNGGFKGDSFSCRDIATNVWECNGTFQAGTTPTTPYSASTT
jgi:hypothetical protein